MKKISELNTRLAELEEAINRFPVRAEYVFADLAALGFARDVLENGHAVALLAQSPVPRSLYPCARAAFEALFELVYLLKSSDFNLMGCRAHVAEQYNLERLRGLAREIFVESGFTDLAAEIDSMPSVAQLIEEERRGWEHLAPGKSQPIENAVQDIEKLRMSRIFSWCGLSRTALHKEAAALIGGTAIEKIILSWYSLLSGQAHPAPRIDSHNLSWQEDGTLVLGTPEDHRELSIAMGIGAAHTAANYAAHILREFQAAIGGGKGQVDVAPA